MLVPEGRHSRFSQEHLGSRPLTAQRKVASEDNKDYLNQKINAIMPSCNNGKMVFHCCGHSRALTYFHPSVHGELLCSSTAERSRSLTRW